MIALALTLILSAPMSETVLFLEGQGGYGWIISQRPPVSDWYRFDLETIQVNAVAEPSPNDGTYFVLFATYWPDEDRYVLWVEPSPREDAITRVVMAVRSDDIFEDGFESGYHDRWSGVVGDITYEYGEGEPLPEWEP